MLDLIERFDPSNPLEKSILVRKRARMDKNYELYIAQFYEDLEEQLHSLEHQAAILHEQGEDLITTFIVNGLQNRGYTVTHDGNANGHVDINVSDLPFTWFGEAKLQKGNVNTYDGFQQLTTRYSRCNKYGYHGGVIVYHQNKEKNAKTALKEWRDYLISDAEKIGINCMEIPERCLYFDTNHEHETNGDPYLIRHFWVNLTFNPKK